MDSSKPRPQVDVTNPASGGEWLRCTIGTSALSGYFNRDDIIVHTPREGEDGYVPLGDVLAGDLDGPAQVRSVDASHIAATVNWACQPYRIGKDGTARPARFAVEIARDAVSRPDLCSGLRRLSSVVHTPVMRADGTVLAEPGYDAASGILYLPAPELRVRVPLSPSPSDVSASVALLSSMLADFTWAGEHDYANYLGLLLTPLLGAIAPSPYKLTVISAPQPGSGKTLLVTIARILHGGVFRAEMPEDDAELRKQVSAILDQTTGPVVCMDNVTGVLRSSVLSGLLTSSRWDDRRLGTSQMISRANNRVWVLTGNNVTLGGDLARRTLWVTIDPGVPHPERRTDFAIADLEGWVRERRGELLTALLTLVRSWVLAGGPLTATTSSDGYAHWRQVVGGILSHAGIAGVFDDSSSARQDVGGDDDEWRDFLTAIHSAFGDETWAVKDVLTKINTIGAIHDVARPIAVDSLPSKLADKLEQARGNTGSIAKSLGRWLMNREGRWAGGYVARSAGRDSVTNVRIWKVVKINTVNTATYASKLNDTGYGPLVGLTPTIARFDSVHMFEYKSREGLGSNPSKTHTQFDDILMAEDV